MEFDMNKSNQTLSENYGAGKGQGWGTVSGVGYGGGGSHIEGVGSPYGFGGREGNSAGSGDLWGRGIIVGGISAGCFRGRGIGAGDKTKKNRKYKKYFIGINNSPLSYTYNKIQ